MFFLKNINRRFKQKTTVSTNITEMEMWIWQLYQNEINFFEREADKLLVEIDVDIFKCYKYC